MNARRVSAHGCLSGPHGCPICHPDRYAKRKPPAPAVTPDPRPTLGDLLVELLAAFTTSNANVETLADRVEALEAKVRELSHMATA